MANFAKLDDNNVVIDIHSVHNDVATDEATGVTFLNNLYNTDDNWKQTSCNTRGNVHRLGGAPFRKNYAVIGATYDETRDAFISDQPYPSFTLNETTCLWDAPVAYPDDGQQYVWNEATLAWDFFNT